MQVQLVVMSFFHLEIHSLGAQLDDSRDESLKEVIDPGDGRKRETRSITWR
jgi:hypothetical protein